MDAIVADNIRAVAAIYAAAQLERMRLFDAVDGIAEMFLNGMLPLGFSAAGKKVDEYYWSRENRLTAAERRRLYDRTVGTENSAFADLWMRFIASIAEYERQQNVESMLAVRVAGRDLATNASLHGFGIAASAARRLADHIRLAFDILRTSEVQKAFGCRDAYQVIERVASREFGAPPNIIRYRTTADAGKRVLDLVAHYASKWSSRSKRPLFRIGNRGGADIADADRDELIRLAGALLAVSVTFDDGSEAAQNKTGLER